MRKLFQSPQIILFGIFVLAAYFRFNNLNWDSNFHLHPDERFLTMVGNAMQIPSSISEYLNPALSKLNPVNINFPFFVYGVFPITLNKLFAVISGFDTYNGFTILGRFLSGLVDIFTVLLVYKTAKLLVNKQTSNIQHQTSNIPLWSTFFYAIAVLPMQLSHYFAVDTFLNLFMFGSFYFALRFSAFDQLTRFSRPMFHRTPQPSQFMFLFLSAIFFGLALAAKITAVFILPLIMFFIFFKGHPERSEGSKEQSERRVRFIRFFTPLRFVQNDKGRNLLFLLLFFIIAYFALRLANPYYFESANFFDPRPNTLLVQNLESLKSFEGKDIWYPPAVQWMNKNPTFSLVNLALFGVGIPYFIFVIIGMIFVISNFQFPISKKFLITNYQLPIILVWTLGFFVYQSFQFVKAMRYFIFLYPFLAIFAGIGVTWLINVIARSGMTKQSHFFVLRLLRFTRNDKIISLFLIIVLLVWPVAYSSIYTNKNSRAAASEWMYKNLPSESVILSEHWDDGLPLPLEENYGKQFRSEQLPVFDPDTEEKWNKMNELLGQADYYVLSSNRGWGSIPTVPEKYPKMSKFYKDLLANNLRGFKKIGEFVSYPKIQFQISNFKFQISLPDQWADESYTVYDHPKVLIFERL